MADDVTVTLRFKTSPEVVNSLVDSWLRGDEVTIIHAGGETTVDLTYVKERD